MGNILRHSYHRVQDEIVWKTVWDDLPALKVAVIRAIAKLDAFPGLAKPPTN